LPVFSSVLANVSVRAEALVSEAETEAETEAEAEDADGLLEVVGEVTEGVEEGQEQRAEAAEVVFLQLKSTTPKRLTRVSNCFGFIKIPISSPDERYFT
jgi:hypothetical protein